MSPVTNITAAFSIEVLGKFFWRKNVTMTIKPNYRIDINFSDEKKLLTLDLRNYLFRKSKSTRRFTYAFESINSAKPEKVKICLLAEEEKDPKEVAKMIHEVSDWAYF